MTQPQHRQTRRMKRSTAITAAAVGTALLLPLALPATAHAAPTNTVAPIPAANTSTMPTGFAVDVDDNPNTAANWMLTHAASGAQVDLSSIVNDPAFDAIDVDAALVDLAGKLAAGNSAVVLHTGLTPGGAGNSSAGAHAGSSNVGGPNAGVVKAAYSAIGTPYRWGGTTPNGFDCSGFVQWAHAQAGKSIPRTSGAQASAGTPVDQADMQPGDVIVYYPGASHVGIYVGNGTMIDSLGDGYTVAERPVDYMPIHSVVRF